MALEMLDLPKKRGTDVKLSNNKIIVTTSGLAKEGLDASALASAEYVNLGYDKETREVGIEALEEGVIGIKLGRVKGNSRVIDASELFNKYKINPVSVESDGNLRRGSGEDQNRFLFGLMDAAPQRRRLESHSMN